MRSSSFLSTSTASCASFVSPPPPVPFSRPSRSLARWPSRSLARSLALSLTRAHTREKRHQTATSTTIKKKKKKNSDSFGGRSPERVASDALRTLFTFVSAKIILAQLEGSGRGGLAAYDKKAYDDLAAALATFNETGGGGGEEEEEEEEGTEEGGSRRSGGGAGPSSPPPSSAAPPKKSTGGGGGGGGGVSGKGDLWLARLSRKNPALALRVMEVRAAYADDDFEWDQCKRLATEGLAAANLDILKARLGSAWAAGDASSDEE